MDKRFGPGRELAWLGRSLALPNRRLARSRNHRQRADDARRLITTDNSQRTTDKPAMQMTEDIIRNVVQEVLAQMGNGAAL